jgi:hypothetical protein
VRAGRPDKEGNLKRGGDLERDKPTFRRVKTLKRKQRAQGGLGISRKGYGSSLSGGGVSEMEHQNRLDGGGTLKLGYSAFSE